MRCAACAAYLWDYTKASAHYAATFAVLNAMTRGDSFTVSDAYQKQSGEVNQARLGAKMLVDVSDVTVNEYQIRRLKEEAAPKSIHEEVGFLLRLLGERGDAIRAKLKRAKGLKLKAGPIVGKAYSANQKAELLKAAVPASTKGQKAQKGRRSLNIPAAIVLALNAGLRDAEIRNLTWAQIDFEKRLLTVGRAKTEAGEGRIVPLNDSLMAALLDHSRWFTNKFGIMKPDWYLFPGRVGKPAAGQKRPLDPTRAITSLKTAWRNVRLRLASPGDSTKRGIP
ncbi:MAG: tyrosine-type recombinase/integrase [Bryobacteraceae bacterium]